MMAINMAKKATHLTNERDGNLALKIKVIEINVLESTGYEESYHGMTISNVGTNDLFERLLCTLQEKWIKN